MAFATPRHSSPLDFPKDFLKPSQRSQQEPRRYEVENPSVRYYNFPLLAKSAPPPDWGLSKIFQACRLSYGHCISRACAWKESRHSILWRRLSPLRGGPGEFKRSVGGTPAIAAGWEIAYRHRSVR